MKCSECEHRKFTRQQNGIGRHYCTNKKAAESVNAEARLICKTVRGGDDLQIKTTPRWCPIKTEGGKDDETPRN